MAIPRRYWDSDAFLGWLNKEPDKVEACQGVLQAAGEGKLQIVTSTLTLAEVIKLKDRPPLKRDKEETINRFFENEYIIVVEVNRDIAEYARQLLWDYEALKPKDAIHIATALFAKIPRLETFDKDLIGLNGKLGNPTLRIGKPDYSYQLGLSIKNE